MEWGAVVVPSIIAILVSATVWLALSKGKLKKENDLLKQIVKTKDTTIANLEASRISVKEVIENYTIADKVMGMLHTGASREEVATHFHLPVERIEVIVKLDKMKKSIR